MKKTTLLAAGALTVTSTASFAAPYVADARSQGMGNTGVVSADFLTAPLHNPALGAIYKDNDDFGLLLPAIGINAHDKDESLSQIEDMEPIYDNLNNAIALAESTMDEQDIYDAVNHAQNLQTSLNGLDGKSPVTVNGGLTAVIAIPTRFASVNLFSASYIEMIVQPEIAVTEVSEPTTAQEASDYANDVLDSYDDSRVHLAAFAVSEVGVSFARNFEVLGQNFAFGVSPKFQQLITYSDSLSLEDFELDEYDQGEVSKSAFNMDFGMLWHANAFRAGITVKDVFKQEIETANSIKGKNYTYQLAPKATLGLGYVGDYFTLSADYDLTTQKRFLELDGDDSQFVRVGAEINAWGWAQLRAGYEMDLQDNLEDSITAGIGISPFDVLSLDIAASYAGENQAGVSANLALTF